MKLQPKYNKRLPEALDVSEVASEVLTRGNGNYWRYDNEGDLERMSRHIGYLQEMLSAVVGLAAERGLFTKDDVEELLPDYEVVETDK